MGAGVTYDAAYQARRPTADGDLARGAERDLRRALDRLPRAGAAEGPAAETHGLGRLPALAMGWYHRTLYVAECERVGRTPNPTTAIIDRQTTKAAQQGDRA